MLAIHTLSEKVEHYKTINAANFTLKPTITVNTNWHCIISETTNIIRTDINIGSPQTY